MIQVLYTFILFFPLIIVAQNNTIKIHQATTGTVVAPLELEVGQYGTIQVFRNGFRQLYSPSSSPNASNLYNSFYLAIDNYVIASNARAIYYENAQWDTPGNISSITGNGSVSNPWTVSQLLTSSARPDYQLHITYSYINGKDWIKVSVIPVIPSYNTATIKFAHCIDTYLGGSDNGQAYTVGQAPFEVVGVENTYAGTGIWEAFIVGNKPWENYVSDQYYSVINNPIGGANLNNQLNYHPNTDNGIGVQWNLGQIAGTQSEINYFISFSDDVILSESEVNNFSAKVIDKNNVRLSWQTNFELNLARFEIELLDFNHNNYETMHSIDAQMISTKTNSYEYLLKGLSSGHYYARLKMIKGDGAYFYSDVSYFEVESIDNELVIFPQPTSLKQPLMIQTKATTQLEEGGVQMIDASAFIHTVYLKRHSSEVYSIDVSQLNPGIYILPITLGTQVIKKRVVLRP